MPRRQVRARCRHDGTPCDDDDFSTLADVERFDAADADMSPAAYFHAYYAPIGLLSLARLQRQARDELLCCRRCVSAASLFLSLVIITASIIYGHAAKFTEAQPRLVMRGRSMIQRR